MTASRRAMPNREGTILRAVTCPFCGETDFDLIGLKRHFLLGWCETFENTPTKDQ